MESSISGKRGTLLIIAFAFLFVTALCSVSVGLVFGKYYNLSNTFGYPDITNDLIQNLRDNVSDPVPIVVTPLSSFNLSYLAINILGIKLNLNFSADADLVVLGRRNWPPTLEEYEAVSVIAENVALNPLNRSSTLRSCHGEILFLGYYAKNQSIIGKNSTLFIGTDITEEGECVGTGFSGIAAGVLLAAVGATSLLVGAVMAAIVFVDRWRHPGAAQGYRTLPR
eukprot:TRINITY_DN12387_c0_g1_i1.p1 TRINITY_DN12387_c0_g1~~TRINITY_DN12387_c0_g1_i1.p1  ORF type:complete len:225 (+),score=17.95 TRINITY_DN12387_c0_g1_i1:127-801(+)